MKLRIVSDLHFEFQLDDGECLTREIFKNPELFDVLVVAGDVSNFRGLNNALHRLAQAAKAADRQIVYVLGNHELYGGTRTGAIQTAVSVEAAFPDHFHFLEVRVKTVLGQRFVGCTLWFLHGSEPIARDGQMADFQYIKDIYDFIGEVPRNQAAFLKNNIRPGDVVVTHHLPHPKSIASEYKGSPLNMYFLHDLTNLVERGGAQLWVHGHTHTSCDYRAPSSGLFWAATRVVCNPFGYAGEPNLGFKSACDVQLLVLHYEKKDTK